MRDAGRVSERNVLGEELEPCGTDPLTGFYRDGCCNTGPEDLGSHTICAVVTAEFLEHQISIGNDLSTPRPEFRFPGLVPGDRWCVTAMNWARAYNDGSRRRWSSRRPTRRCWASCRWTSSASTPSTSRPIPARWSRDLIRRRVDQLGGELGTPDRT